MSVNYELLKKIFKYNDAHVNSIRAKKIVDDTIHGDDEYYYENFSDKVKSNLLSSARQDAAWCALNTVMIYNEVTSNGRSARWCRLIIVSLLFYIAYRVS